MGSSKKLWALRALKLFVLIGVPVLGACYAYQFTGQDREIIVPFHSFKVPPTTVYREGKADRAVTLTYREPVTIVNFWATWCPPCVEEFPAMIELRRQLAKKHVEIYFVSVDDSWENVEKFLRVNQIAYDPEHMLWDPKKIAAQDWGSVKFPETYVVRRDGWAVEKIIGAQQWTRPVVLKYFVSLAEKFENVSSSKTAWFPGFISSAWAQTAATETILHEDDKKTLERMRANIETATQNLQKAEAAQREEERNLKELRITYDRRLNEQKESEADLEKIEAKLREAQVALNKTLEAQKAEQREKTRVEQKIKDIQGRIAALSKQLEQAKDELTQANKGLSSRVENLETLEKAKDSSNEELGSIKGKSQKARGLVTEKRQATQESHTQIQARERKLREIQAQVSQADTTLKNQKAKLDEFERLLKK